MTALEDRLRERFASVAEPELSAPRDLVRRVRAAHRRRQVVPLALGAAAVGAVSAALLQVTPGEPARTASGSTPSPAADPSRGPCNVERLLARGGPKSIVEFQWPSGARVVTLRAARCPVYVMLSTAEVRDVDRAAAESRWGDDIVLLPRDETVNSPMGGAPTP